MARVYKMIAAAVFAVFITGAAFGQDYSAEMVSTSKEGVVKGKICVTKDKVRMEMAGVVTITRMDKKAVYLIMPGQNMYMEQPFNPQNIASTQEKMPNEISRDLLAEESIDGRMAKKYRVVYVDEGVESTILQWIDNQTNMPVKIADDGGSWTVEYRKISVAEQPASLFEIPAGYKNMTSLGPAMGEMLGGMGSED